MDPRNERDPKSKIHTLDGAGIFPGARRYTPQEKARAIALAAKGKKRSDISKEIGASTESIRLWIKQAKEKGTFPSVEQDGSPKTPGDQIQDPSAPCTRLPREDPPPATTAPIDPAHGLSAHEVAAILDVKKKHPSMGPAQIRAQLKRYKAWRISAKAIGKVLKDNGYELEHRCSTPKGFEPQRFEAPHRNALWQLDFLELRIATERLYVLVILDDFSRFLVAHSVLESPNSEAVVETFQQAIHLHGKPEAVYTDRAGAFLAWRNPCGFQRFLETNLIDHHVSRSYHPQGRGKVEALIRTLQIELWEVQHFLDQDELRKALDAFALHYNFERAHMGIDGLCPADRFFGRWPQVLDRINALSRKRNDAASLSSPLMDDAFCTRSPVEALRLMIRDGKLELRFFGHRVVLGEVEL